MYILILESQAVGQGLFADSHVFILQLARNWVIIFDGEAGMFLHPACGCVYVRS